MDGHRANRQSTKTFDGEFSAEEPETAPRVLVRISRGMVTVRSDLPLRLTVVDDDIEVRCDDVRHRCSSQEIDALLAYVASYRYDRLFCMETSRAG